MEINLRLLNLWDCKFRLTKIFGVARPDGKKNMEFGLEKILKERFTFLCSLKTDTTDGVFKMGTHYNEIFIEDFLRSSNEFLNEYTENQEIIFSISM